MPERPGGFEKREIDDGFRALATAGGPDDLKGLIESMPVLRSPIFHAQLRQYRLSTLREFEKHQENLKAFMSVYDAFFNLLHQRAYYQQAEPPTDTFARSTPAEPFAPRFLLEVVRSLGQQFPLRKGPAFNPATDAAGIEVELFQVLSKPAVLPAYEPIPGSLWGVVLVTCARCRQMRVTVRAHSLDLARAPELLAPLEQGRINVDLCTRCGSACCVPRRIWIQEQPAPFDNLAALSCICRVRPDEAEYLPPPGTVRNEAFDRILEIRMDMLMRQLSSDPLRIEEREAGVQTNGIAYSLEELLWRIHQTSHAAPETVEYRDIAEDVYRKLTSGLLSYREAEEQILHIVSQVGKDWPLVAAEPGGDLVRALVLNLIAEACAAARSLAFAFRADRAGVVAQCYTGLGEIGLAQTCLARARDLLAQETDMAMRDGAAMQLNNVEADLLSAEGRVGEAEALRRGVLESAEADPQTPQGRLTRRQLLMNEAQDLKRTGRLAEAMERMTGDIAEFETLVREFGTSASASVEVASARSGLSGTLANLAGVYSACAKSMDLLHRLVGGAPPNELPPHLLARLAQIGSPEALIALQQELGERVAPLLAREFPNGYTPATLLERAETLLKRGIAIARDIGHFEYLSIQSHALGLLLDELGRPGEAKDAMQDCLRYGARIADYRRMAKASRYIATAEIALGDKKAALAELKKCIRFDMRDSVRRGDLAESMADRIGADALASTNCSGDAATAILIAETGKALPIAISLMRGVPLQAAAAQGGGPAATPLDALFDRRETLRLKAMWDSESAPELQQQLAAVNAELDTARTELGLRDSRYSRWHDATYLEVSEPAAVRRILGNLGPRATFAGFLVQGNLVYTYALWSDGAVVERRPLSGELLAIKGAVGQALEPSVLTALAAVLLDPLADRLRLLEPQDRLILSPSAPFDRLPFGLFPFGKGVLCEQATLSVVDGVGMLEVCSARPAPPLREAVCIGAPVRTDVPDLPHAAEELEQIAALLGRAGVSVGPILSGRAATVGALAVRSAACDLVHFACHAVAPGPGYPEAQLLLAPNLLAQDSGVLSEDRVVAGLLLKPGCHINLSGCKTGVAGGQGRFYPHGLAPSFLVAGAGSVLASLWPLEDEPAAHFQATYYQRLAAGSEPAFALAATQRACIRGEAGEGLRDPAAWAPYLLYGVR